MFGWSTPKCPVDPYAKAWIEERLLWLEEQFENNVFNGKKPQVLPLREFFPDPYDGSEESVRALLDRTCEYMGVDPGVVEMELVSDAGNLWLVN
jgi:hypothetical protein